MSSLKIKEKKSTLKSTIKFDLSKEEKENMLLINKIENLFLGFKGKEKSEPPEYFNKFKYLNLFIMVLNIGLLQYVNDLVMKSKHKYYCFNTKLYEFEVCEVDSGTCQANDFVWKEFLVNFVAQKDVIKERDELNNIFRDFIFKEYMIFTTKNYNKLDKFESTFNKFRINIIVSYGETQNYFWFFGLVCATTQTVVIGIVILAGMVAGNILMTFLADVFGRLKIIRILIIAMGVLALAQFFFAFSFKYSINFREFDVKKNEKIINDYNKYVISNRLDSNFEEYFSEIMLF